MGYNKSNSRQQTSVRFRRSPVWWGFADFETKIRLQAKLQKLIKFGFLTKKLKTIHSLICSARNQTYILTYIHNKSVKLCLISCVIVYRRINPQLRMIQLTRNADH